MRIFKLVLGLCLICVLAMISYILFNVNKALKYYPIIEQYSQQYNVDPLFITSIIKVESNFNPDAKSKKGAIGLMQAIKRFNPSNGVRLATYAMHWIKSEIHEFILNNWKLVKVATTKAQRKLFFNLKKYKKNVQWLSNKEVSKVASDLEVTPKDVTEMELKMSDSEVSYDADEPEILCLEDKRSDFAKIIENNDYKNTIYKNLKNALQSLDERSRFIIQKRYLEEQCTLTELSKILNISIERVRQIENNALKLLKVYMGNKNV